MTAGSAYLRPATDGRPWRNWETRTVQVRVPKGVVVRLHSGAPFSRIVDRLRSARSGSGLRSLSRLQDAVETSRHFGDLGPQLFRLHEVTTGQGLRLQSAQFAQPVLRIAHQDVVLRFRHSAPPNPRCCTAVGIRGRSTAGSVQGPLAPRRLFAAGYFTKGISQSVDRAHPVVHVRFAGPGRQTARPA